ncbi:pyranose dehydrogenase [Cyathus striatus]|nr:pyranose dehydrogenase [Cyathus striatus]
MISRVFALLALSSVCSAALFQSVADLPKKVDYDFVIVGGGTAGAVLANRLTEIPKFKVLVIEAGHSNEGAVDSEIPFFAARLFGSQYDWNYTTTPQSALGGRVIPYPRGFILGGSSAINGLIYTRGSSSDYDRFAAITGDAGWSWNRMLPYLLKVEKWSLPPDRHDTTGQYDPQFHNTSGVNADGLTNAHPTDGKVIQTTQDLSDTFPFNLDLNSGNPLGVAWAQATIGNGTRSTSATSYLAPNYINRPNLYVVINTKVTRVLPTGTGKGKPDIRTVEISSGSSKPITITAKKELVLSAGSVGTPHILLSSGIGNSSELNQVGVKPVFNLPDVGKNLSDHIGIQISWAVNSNDTRDNLAIYPDVMAAALAEWNANRTGPLTDITGAVSHVAFLRLPDNSSIFETVPDPSSGSNAGHYELVFSNGGTITPGSTSHYFTMGVAVVSPTSRGQLTLNSSNPLDAPLINPNALTTDFDLFALRYAVRSAVAFLNGPAWNGYILNPSGLFQNVTVDNDDSLNDFIRASTGTVFHPIGTSSMSAKNASDGVVDPDLKVKGVSGLRIVDASVMPRLICGHTQAPVYGIAERAADIIRGDWA